ncbi:copper homeostasis protein CutC [Mycetocola tolaasinivorans]|nr:copper homeostasis protein CutC [Mycetocola tolaasinivorans]
MSAPMENSGRPAVTLEMAVGDLAGTRIATDLGLDRIELCAGLELGGLSPSDGLVEAVLEQAHTAVTPAEVHVLVRPRPGGFDFTPDEVAVMIAEVRSYARRGVDGVVIGALRDGELDRDAHERLIEAAEGIHVTLHRAFDYVRDQARTLESLHGSGIGRILTSGGASSVGDAISRLRELVPLAGDITLMAGGGLSPENCEAVAATGVGALHFSARSARPAEAGVSLGSATGEGPGLVWSTDRDRAATFVRLLRAGTPTQA